METRRNTCTQKVLKVLITSHLSGELFRCCTNHIFCDWQARSLGSSRRLPARSIIFNVRFWNENRREFEKLQLYHMAFYAFLLDILQSFCGRLLCHFLMMGLSKRAVTLMVSIILGVALIVSLSLLCCHPSSTPVLDLALAEECMISRWFFERIACR